MRGACCRPGVRRKRFPGIACVRRTCRYVSGRRSATGAGIMPFLFARIAVAMTQPHVHELIELLQLDRLEDNLFRGQSRDIGTRYVFGGQVLGQALSAAQQTVDAARPAHSLHAYFLRAGDVEAPIVYHVDRARDVHSFSVRRVEAIQHGQPILNCAVSFQVDEDGFEHQTSMPEVPKPDDLEPAKSLPQAELAKLPPKLQRWLSTDGPFEYRFV